LAQDNLVYARDYYQMSLNISERLAKQVSGGVSQRDQYLSYLRLGDICIAEDTKHSLAEAAQHYEQAYEIAGLIEDPPDMLEWQWDMNTIHTCLGDVYLRQKQYDDAMRQFEESKKILHNLRKSDDSIHMQLSRSICYERIGLVWYKKRLPIMAQNYFERCVCLRRDILAQEEAPIHQANLGWALYLLACSVPQEERTAHITEAVAIYDVLLRQDPGNELYRGRYKDFLRLANS
jgi:tetratricopeptide (TPR) repeat protein